MQYITGTGDRTEAEVQAEFYYQAKQLNMFDVLLERKLPSDFHGSGYFRADAIIVKDFKILCAVEFKRHNKQKPSPQTRQAKAYKALKVKTFYCIGHRQIDKTMAAICDLLDQLD